MDPAIIGHLVILVTVILVAVLQYIRESRQRKWDVEDRKATAAALIQHTSEAAGKLEGLIHENTKISTDAFQEANSVNQKIIQLGFDLVNGKK